MMSDIIGNIFLFLGVAFLIAKAVREGYESSMSKKTKKKTPSKKPKTWWQKATPFKKLYVKFALGIGAILFILFIALVVRLVGMIISYGDSSLSDITSNFALAFLGTISGGVALFGGWLAILRSEENKRQNDIADKQNDIIDKQNEIANKQSDIANTQNEIANKQADTAEQGQITDRLNKAVEGLGKIEENKPVVEVRLGALYALERIAKDSLRDHSQIVEILCAYVRTNSNNRNKPTGQEPIREDIQAALTIIGRRGDWPKGKKRLQDERKRNYKLDLRDCCFKRAEIRRVDFSYAWLRNADFQQTILIGANLSHAWLHGAKLNGTFLNRADTTNAHAHTGDFSKCKNLTQKQLNVMYCGLDVKIPSNLSRPSHWPTKSTEYSVFESSYYKWVKTKIKQTP